MIKHATISTTVAAFLVCAGCGTERFARPGGKDTAPEAASPSSATDEAGKGKVAICHIPPGNPGNAHTIWVGQRAVAAHMRHGDTIGPCPQACTPGGNTCEEGEFCAIEPGVCDPREPGDCVPVPEICPPVFDPVCGCDGQTYSNACFAAMAGVNVASMGECPVGCEENSDCADTDYCTKAPEDCAGAGECVARPEVCIGVYDPICGCDGQTYSNACFAAIAGVNVASMGECPVGCEENSDCADTDYCAKSPEDCAGTGVCEARPDVCVDVYDPVCGCDGQTYSNACFAAAAGVNVASMGECRVGCEENGDCAETDYCTKAPEDCAGTGECVARPEVCIGVYDPICGCDGQTYNNACFAAMAGVNVASMGECPVGCEENSDCADADYCAKAVGDCTSIGVCEVRPDTCPDIFDPVCACDGQTYINACFAGAAGVNVTLIGECPVGCVDNSSCADTDYCAKPLGNCGDVGACEVRPDDCIDVFDPVCGCDGQTYINACFAAAAGVNVTLTGECNP